MSARGIWWHQDGTKYVTADVSKLQAAGKRQNPKTVWKEHQAKLTWKAKTVIQKTKKNWHEDTHEGAGAR